jgi:hypothetical protein
MSSHFKKKKDHKAKSVIMGMEAAIDVTPLLLLS